MHIVASQLLAADLATELELSADAASQYLDSLLTNDEEEEWTGVLDEANFPSLTIRD